MIRSTGWSLLFVLGLAPTISAQNLQILSIDPAAAQNHVAVGANVVIQFDDTIAAASLTPAALILRGRQGGLLEAGLSGGGTATVTVDPLSDFLAGDVISLTLTTALLSESGHSLARGHTYSFTVASLAAPAPPAALAQRVIGSGDWNGRDIRALDYDGDGDMDVVSAHEGTPEKIVVYENDGSQELCAFNTGGSFRLAEVYDIDGDGDYDHFGATGSFDTELNWFENEGAPPYTERFISSEDPWTLAGGDLDSDGDVDVVAAVLIPNRVLWFANNGTGSFNPGQNIPSSFNGGSDSYFYVRDINSDGAMDILAFHRDAFDMVWYENNGSQSFTEHLVLNSPDRGRAASGDLDDDGDVDLVFVSVENGPTLPLAWFENDGNENFTQHSISATSTGRLYVVDIADLDGDQDMDIIAGGYWFENDGEENFSEAPLGGGLELDGEHYANGLDHADMDGDGDLDPVVLGGWTTAWYEQVSILELLSTSPVNGSEAVPTTADITLNFDQPVDITSANPASIRVTGRRQGAVPGTFGSAAAETVVFTPDQRFLPGDLIEVSINHRLHGIAGQKLESGHGFRFRVAAGVGELADFTPHSVHVLTNSVTGMDLSDIDGDGDVDIATCSWGEVNWHENDGAGGFATHAIPSTVTPVGLLAFDQDDDGDCDIWVDVDGSSSPSVIYTNDGSQNFSESTVSGAVRIRQAVDINLDGDRDVLFLSTFGADVAWSDAHCGGYSGYGDMPDVAGNDVEAADLDGDGDMDFTIAGSGSEGTVVFEHDGYGLFAAQAIDTTGARAVALADFDGDNDLDAAFCESYTEITWYANESAGGTVHFGTRQVVAQLNQNPYDLTAVDLDGDGDPDLAAVSLNDDKVVWFENRLDQAENDFGPEQGGPGIADGPVKIRAGDLDGDGDQDLVTISVNDDELIWWENTGDASTVIFIDGFESGDTSSWS
jgi:hypothetical protein